MKAIIVESFGDESVLKYKDINLPVPQANQVRIKTIAVGINPVDTYIRSGKYNRLPSLPYTPGTDGAGIIDQVGADVTTLKNGDRVFIAAIGAEINSGTYAEYVVCDAAFVHLLPNSLSFEQGAAIGTPGLAAAYALFQCAKLTAGQTVLIHGASGGVGTIAIQLAKQKKAIVYGTAGNEIGKNLLKELGLQHIYNHHDADYIDKIYNDSKGLDIIIEMAAHQNLMKDTTLLNPFGKIVIVGSRGSLDFDPRSLMSKNLQVIGMNLINMSKDDYLTLIHELTLAIKNGLSPIVSQILPLDQVVQAHKAITNNSSKKGNIVLSV